MSNYNDIEWHAQEAWFRNQFDLLGRMGSDPNSVIHCDITVSQLEDDEVISDPSLSISYQSAHSLMDALWAAGVRPKNGAGGIAHVDAMGAHLKDMRRLVFDGKDIK